MKQLFILFMSLFIFLLSTAILVLIPQAVSHPLDVDQKIMIGVMAFAGYLTSGLYFYVYMDNRKRTS